MVSENGMESYPDMDYNGAMSYIKTELTEA